jgi:hypothetical protein
LAKLEDNYFPRLLNTCEDSPRKLRLGRKQIGGNEDKETERKMFLMREPGENILLEM